LQIRVARGFRQRLCGLAWRGPVDYALEFPRTRSIHTFGMRFALDLIWLDRAGAPIRVDRNVPRRRLRSNRAASSVIEVPAGEADRLLTYLRSSR